MCVREEERYEVTHKNMIESLITLHSLSNRAKLLCFSVQERDILLFDVKRNVYSASFQNIRLFTFEQVISLRSFRFRQFRILIFIAKSALR